MNLFEKIKNKKIVIGVIGLGYVGLPLVIEFSKKGFKVIGFDTDREKIKKLLRNESYITHIPSLEIKSISLQFTPTSDFSKLKDVDVIIICVPTPLNKNYEPDMTYIINTAKTIKKYIRKEHLIVLESTTYPGTTEEVLKPILEESGLKAGKDFYLAFSPERVDPGSKKFTISNTPKVVGGYSKKCLEMAKLVYDNITLTVPVSSCKVAEMSKMLENTYRAVNIALVNELKMLCDRMGIDIWEVIEASKTKPFGFHPFYPGPGLGGHCIPIDPFYLSWKAKEFGFREHFIELAGEINSYMPYYVVDKTIEALNRMGRALLNSKILILGLSYKKDIGDPRESPSFKLIELFENYGAKVDYNDPYIPVTPKMRRWSINKKSIELTPKNISKYDCIIVSTDHSIYDPFFIEKYAKLIVDTRNMFRGIKSKKVVKA
jgi:UDP-N-acetyl-D-glucosamine dehydrogenase